MCVTLPFERSVLLGYTSVVPEHTPISTRARVVEETKANQDTPCANVLQSLTSLFRRLAINQY